MKQNGFSLLEVSIAMGVMIFMALGVGSMVLQQSKSIGMLEDRLANVDLKRTLEQALSYLGACDNSFIHKNMKSESINNLVLKDHRGSDFLAPNGDYKSLKIHDIRLSGSSLVASSSNTLDLIVVVQGRNGEVYKPHELKIIANLDKNKKITSCGLTGDSFAEAEFEDPVLVSSPTSWHQASKTCFITLSVGGHNCRTKKVLLFSGPKKSETIKSQVVRQAGFGSLQVIVPKDNYYKMGNHRCGSLYRRCVK